MEKNELREIRKQKFAQMDDMDLHYNKVKCRKIEQMLPKLMKMVEGVRSMRGTVLRNRDLI